MQTRHFKVLIHITIWLALLLMPVIIFPRPGQNINISILDILPVIIFNIYLIGVFYLNAYVLIPKLYIKRKFAFYFLTVAFLLAQFVVLPQYMPSPYNHLASLSSRSFANETDVDVPPPPPDDNVSFVDHNKNLPSDGSGMLVSPGRIERPHPNFFIVRKFAAISIFLLILLLSSSYRISSEWFKLEKRNREIAAEQLHAELHFLKAQINPHFLFNTLNSLYILALKKSDKAPEAILKLSDIMRYVLTETSETLVPLDREITYLKQYIDLQQLRLTEKVNVEMVITGNTTTCMVTPLLFITFIENAFQYGVSTSVDSPINILLEILDKNIHFQVVNKIIRATDPTSTGIGLENTRRKLELLYPDAHTLTISNDGSVFVVDLTIRIKA